MSLPNSSDSTPRQDTHVEVDVPFYDPRRGETIEIGICSYCGAWLPWSMVESAGGLDHRHNAQYVEFTKREAVLR